MELKKIEFSNGLIISVEKNQNSFILKKVLPNGTKKETNYNYLHAQAWAAFRQAKHRALQAGDYIKNLWGN